MPDAFDTPDEPTPTPDTDNPADIPMARPVAVDPALARLHARSPIYLDDMSRGSAWADLGIAIFLIVGIVFCTEIAVATAYVQWVGVSRDDVGWEQFGFERYLVTTIIAVRAGVTLLILRLLLKKRGQSAQTLGLTFRRPIIDGVCGVLAMGVSFGGFYVSIIIIGTFWPELLLRMRQNVELILELIPPLHPLTFGALSLAIGIYEELIFRGYLLTRLRRATGNWAVAVVVSSVLFTLPHAWDQEAIAMVPIGILSVCMSIVTIWRKSIVPAIVGHCLFDWLQFLSLQATFGDQWA